MRLRRKAATEDEVLEVEAGGTTDGADQPHSDDALRAHGPWDASELAVAEDDETRVDLGSLSVKGRDGIEVRLQVDEASQQVAGVMLVAADGAMELRPFAAARHEALWPTVRQAISAEAARHGGTASEVDVAYGRGLELRVPGTDPQGSTVTQVSTVMGIAGPRWMLRVTLFGRPATDYREDGLLEHALRDVVVDRGTEAMPPGEALPLSLPAGARRVEGPA
jgi:Protein of unknown function (DUF3710)